MQYRNYIFDLYGTLIDIHTDEQCAQTWKKWCRWLDHRGIRHAHYISMRRTFFEQDRLARKLALEEGMYSVPEIDVIPIYRKMFLEYGNDPFSQEELEEISYAFRTASREYFRLFPEVEKGLAHIAKEGGRVYLLSNAQASYTVPEIREMGLDRILDDILISSDCGCMKPDPAFFEMLMKRHGMKREETVMLGDSLTSDQAGAIGAGIDFIHLPEGFRMKLLR